MAKYINITSDQTYPNGHTLIEKKTSDFGVGSASNMDINGIIRKIIIANHHATDKNTIQLFLDDGAGSPTRYTIVRTIIPAQATLILTDGIAFDMSKYSLKISTTDTSATALTVIIK